MTRSVSLFVAAIAIATTMFATEARCSSAEDDPRWAGNAEMNGLRWSEFKNFMNEWKLVTVRFRADNGEIRFVYANPTALKALSAGLKTYPVGAAFAKAAYLGTRDSSFAPSLVPDGVSRYQLMVRDQARFKDTGGWGYALFDKDGRTFPGEPHQVSTACNACHQIVSDRGAVFSKALGSAIEPIRAPEFVNVEASTLPPVLVAKLPKRTRSCRQLKGELQKAVFQGTLDELRPFLSEEALSKDVPSVFINTEKTRFAAVFKDPNVTSQCGSGALAGVSMVSVTTVQKTDESIPVYSRESKDQTGIAISSFCMPKLSSNGSHLPVH